jgi:hypothetical protein
VEWDEVYVDSIEYDDVASIRYVDIGATYTLNGIPAHTICRVTRWHNTTTDEDYLYTFLLSASEDTFEIYSNYFYRMKDALKDA